MARTTVEGVRFAFALTAVLGWLAAGFGHLVTPINAWFAWRHTHDVPPPPGGSWTYARYDLAALQGVLALSDVAYLLTMALAGHVVATRGWRSGAVVIAFGWLLLPLVSGLTMAAEVGPVISPGLASVAAPGALVAGLTAALPRRDASAGIPAVVAAAAGLAAATALPAQSFQLALAMAGDAPDALLGIDCARGPLAFALALALLVRPSVPLAMSLTGVQGWLVLSGCVLAGITTRTHGLFDVDGLFAVLGTLPLAVSSFVVAFAAVPALAPRHDPD